MADAHKNLAISKVATAPSPATSGTSLVVTSTEGVKFPAVPFNATIAPDPAGLSPVQIAAASEIVRVTAISTDTLTIVRAQESTAARTVVVGDYISAGVTAKTLTDAETASPAIVTSLPGSPATGDEVILTDSLTAPTYQWRLVYDGAITPGTSKWRYLGGAPIRVEGTTAMGGLASGSTAYQDFTGTILTFTLPVAGTWIFDFGCTYYASFNFGATLCFVYLAPKFGAAATVDTDSTRTINPSSVAGGSSNETMQVDRRITRTVGAVAVKLQGKSSNAGSGGSPIWSAENGWLYATPVLLG